MPNSARPWSQSVTVVIQTLTRKISCRNSPKHRRGRSIMEWGQSAPAVVLLEGWSCAAWDEGVWWFCGVADRCLRLVCCWLRRLGCLYAHVRYAGWNLEGKYWCGIVWKQLSVLNPARKHRQLPSKLHLNPPSSFVWHFYCGAVSRNVNLPLMTFFLLKLGEKPDDKWKTGALVPMATVWAFRWGQHRLLYV